MKKVCISIVILLVLLSTTSVVLGFSGGNLESYEAPVIKIEGVDKDLVCVEPGQSLKLSGETYAALYALPKYSRSCGDTNSTLEMYRTTTRAKTYFFKMTNEVPTYENSYPLWFIASHAIDINDKQTGIWHYLKGEYYSSDWDDSDYRAKGKELLEAGKIADGFLKDKIEADNEFTIVDKTEYVNDDTNKKLKVEKLEDNNLIVGPYEIYYDYSRYTGSITESTDKKYLDIKFSDVIKKYIVDEKGNYIKDVSIVYKETDASGNTTLKESEEILPDEPFYIKYDPYDGEENLIPYARLKLDFTYLSGFTDKVYNKYHAYHYWMYYTRTSYTHSVGEDGTCRDYIYTKVQEGDYPHDNDDQSVADIEAKEVWKYDSIILAPPEPEEELDLSLKKFISEVNESSISDRVTVSDTGKLYDRTAYNSTYKKKKNPYELTDKIESITFTIRIYNEGNIAGKATFIEDILPEGLVFDSCINNAGYDVNCNGRKITFEDRSPDNEDHVRNIPAFTGGELYFTDIKIKCKLTNKITDEITDKEQIYDLSMEQSIESVNDGAPEVEDEFVKVKTDDIIKYKITVRNNEDTDVLLKEIKQALPKGIEFVKPENDDKDSNGIYIDENNYWSVASDYDGTSEISRIINETIGKKSVESFYIKCKVTAKTGVLKTVSEIVSTAEPDINESDWKDYSKVIVKNKEDKYIDLELTQEILSINGGSELTGDDKKEKSLSKGDVVTYKITVKNTGEIEAKNIKIANYVPDGMKFIPNDEEYGELKEQSNDKDKFPVAEINKNWVEDTNKNRTCLISKDEFDLRQNKYKEIEISCIVTEEGSFKNIAEIISFEGDGNIDFDIDSDADNVDLDEYLYEKQEDDDDFTIVSTETKTISNLVITTTDISGEEKDTGDVISYDVIIENKGEMAAEVTIKDVLEGMEAKKIDGNLPDVDSNSATYNYDEANKTIKLTENVSAGATIRIPIECKITEEATTIELVNEKDTATEDEKTQGNKTIKHIAYIETANVYDKTKHDWKAEKIIETIETDEPRAFEKLENNVIEEYTKYLTNKAMIIETSKKDRDTSDWKDSETICITKVDDSILRVVKEWEDENNKYGKRPSYVEVKLLENEVEKETVKLKPSNKWKYTFTDLDPTKEYTVKEVAVKDYDSETVLDEETNTVTITNYYDGDTNKKEITVNKEWEDNNNADGKRPNQVTVKLLKDGQVYRTATLSESTGWSHTFRDLPVGSNYTVDEEAVPYYEKNIDGYTITNKLPTVGKSIIVKKVWADDNNKYGKRPSEVTVKLLDEEGNIYKTAILNETNGWTHTFTGLNESVKYTVDENDVPYYLKSINGYTITNTYYGIGKQEPVTMEIAGNVFEDLASTKGGDTDGLLGVEDLSFEGIQVTLYEEDGTMAELIQQYEEDPNMLYTEDEKKQEKEKQEQRAQDIQELETIMYRRTVEGKKAEIPITKPTTLVDYDDRVKKLIEQGKVEIRTNPTITDKNGEYIFKGLDPNKKYKVQFRYNGLVYEAVEKDDNIENYNTELWSKTSKAVDKEGERDGLKEKFQEIRSYPYNYKVSEGEYNKVYLQSDLESQKIYDGYNIYDLITNRIRTYMNQHNSYPDIVGTIYKEIIDAYKPTDSEIENKLQFIEDCKIIATTDIYPISVYDEFLMDEKRRESYEVGSSYLPLYKDPISDDKIEKLDEELDGILDEIVKEADKINGDNPRTGIKGKKINTISDSDEYDKIDWTFNNGGSNGLIDSIYNELEFYLKATSYKTDNYIDNRSVLNCKIYSHRHTSTCYSTVYIELNHNSASKVTDEIFSKLLDEYADDLNEMYKVIEDVSQSNTDKSEIIEILENDIEDIETIVEEMVKQIIEKAKDNAKHNFESSIKELIKSVYFNKTQDCDKPSNYLEYSKINIARDDTNRYEKIKEVMKNAILNEDNMEDIVDIYSKQLKIENIYSSSWIPDIKFYDYNVDYEHKTITVIPTTNPLDSIKEQLIKSVNSRFGIEYDTETYGYNADNIGTVFDSYTTEIQNKITEIIELVQEYYSEDNITWDEIKGFKFIDNANLLYPGQKQIHFGLVKREEFDLTIAKDVYKVDLSINGRDMTYYYNNIDIDPGSNNWITEVRAQDIFYERNIYASDYKYWERLQKECEGKPTSEAEEIMKKSLAINVTYRIALRNQTSKIIGEIIELVDYYDRDYTFVEAFLGDGSGNLAQNCVWDDSSIYTDYAAKNKNDLNVGFIRFEDGLQIENEEDKFIYVTFKINEDANGIIADGQINIDGLKELNESKHNIVEINGYKTYYDNGCTEYNGIRKVRGENAYVIDKDSRPGNYIPENNYDVEEKQYYADEDDVGVANGLYILIDYFNQRTIQGTVWEDSPDKELLFNDNIRQGNGSYDEGEKLVQNAMATLMKYQTGDAYKEENIAWYYKIIETESPGGGGNTVHKGEWLPAQIYTDENGQYALTGFVPGEYDVWFTYDNNSISPDIDVISYNETRYNGQDFKSTIYTDKTDEDEWYKHEDNRNSDAKDIWSRRETVNDYSRVLTNDIAERLVPSDLGKYNTEATKMHARTDKLRLDVEYLKKESDSISKISEIKIKDDYSKYVIDNVDFGLVERPRAQLSIQKNVVNAKVVLADGTVLFDAIPDADGKFIATNLASIARKLATAYVETKEEGVPPKTKLKNSTHVSTEQGRITMNMDEELMQGANLQVTYEIEVTNVGEKDYNTEDFYNYGTNKPIDESSIVKTKVDQIIDYVENNMKFAKTLNRDASTPINDGWEVKAQTDIGTDRDRSDVVLKDTVIQALFNGSGVTDDAYNTIAVLTGEATAKEGSALAIDDELEPDETAKSDFILTQLISPENESDDLTYKNVLEIIKTTNDVGRRMHFSIAGNHVPAERDEADPAEVLKTSLRPIGYEVDTDDGELITIIPPFGANMVQDTHYAIFAIALIAVFGAGVYLIKKKVLK